MSQPCLPKGGSGHLIPMSVLLYLGGLELIPKPLWTYFTHLFKGWGVHWDQCLPQEVPPNQGFLELGLGGGHSGP